VELHDRAHRLGNVAFIYRQTLTAVFTAAGAAATSARPAIIQLPAGIMVFDALLPDHTYVSVLGHSKT